jgi:hypothetical protein
MLVYRAQGPGSILSPTKIPNNLKYVLIIAEERLNVSLFFLIISVDKKLQNNFHIQKQPKIMEPRSVRGLTV